jgi:hypothetical protein
MIKNDPLDTEPGIPERMQIFRNLRRKEIHQRVAESLFCSPGFAMVDFKQMDEEDWRLHAQRSWEVAGFFVSEIKQKSR